MSTPSGRWRRNVEVMIVLAATLFAGCGGGGNSACAPPPAGVDNSDCPDTERGIIGRP